MHAPDDRSQRCGGGTGGVMGLSRRQTDISHPIVAVQRCSERRGAQTAVSSSSVECDEHVGLGIDVRRLDRNMDDGCVRFRAAQDGKAPPREFILLKSTRVAKSSETEIMQ
jgi:hypothetical protein